MNPSSHLTPEQARQVLEGHRQRLFFLERQRAASGFDTRPEVLIEIQQIRDQEIPALQAQLTAAAGPAVDEHARAQFDDISLRAGRLTALHGGIRFINREVELKELTHPLAPPYILVEAPAGYGKSFLLERVRGELEKAGWIVCLIDLSNNTAATREKMTFLRTVYGCLPDDAIEDKSIPLPERADRALSSLGSRLVGHMTAGGKPLALLLDGVEAIRKPAFAKWIRDKFIYELGERGQGPADSRFRCIVAGRYIAETWQDQRGKYTLARERFGRPIRLSPFTFEVVLEAVARLARDRGLHDLPREAREHVARAVLIISGGHPQCLVNLLVEISVEYDLNPWHPLLDDLRELFERHVEQSCYAIHYDMPEELAELYPFLCLFRCYNEASVQRIVDWADGRQLLGQKAERDPAKLLRLLTQKGYAVWSRERRYFVDDVSRRMIALQTRLRRPQLAAALNQIALDSYDQSLGQPPMLDAMRYQAMLIEHLYHLSVQLVDSSASSAEAASRFRTDLARDRKRFAHHFKPLLSDMEWDESLNTLLASLRVDDEIQMEMVRAAKDTPYEDLLAP
jgi:hypothetical protein